MTGFSPGWVSILADEALEDRILTISKAIRQVEEKYEDIFTVTFFYPERDIIVDARVVKFSYLDGVFYHVDFKFDGMPEGQIKMLHRDSAESWTTAIEFPERTLVDEVGSAIEGHEAYIAKMRNQAQNLRMKNGY